MPTEYEIAAGGTRAVVTGVGAGLRLCEVDGAPIVESYDAGEHPPMGAGGVLVPWPNRLAGARFTWEGHEYRPEVTEPARGHAIHGLLRRERWSAGERGEDTVTLEATIPASPAWPQPLRVTTTWSVAPGRLDARHTVTNSGDGPVPFGLGTHPYLRVGDAPVADCELRAATTAVVDVDDALVPVAVRDLGPDEDLRGGRRVGDLDLDTCFAAAERLDAEHTLAALRAPDGRSVRLVGGGDVRWVQVFTPGSPFGRGGPAVAVEPMTCPPDALHSGTDLHVLDPGATGVVTWGLVASWGAA